MCYEILQTQYPFKCSAEIFRNSGFIGAFKGKRNLPANYKKALEKGWKKKHDFKNVLIIDKSQI